MSAEEQRFQTAAGHFVTFFRELERAFVERDELLEQIALALLAREHVLMCGPPGTAKSQVASAVLGRIVDEETGAASLFARQFTESTVQTDLVGPIDFKTLTETGRTEHFTDEGMLGAVHAFLDEVLDGRDMLLRSTLNVLHERELKQGGTITKGRIECAAMTTNRYLSEVLEQSRETLLAFVDRIAFVSFVPKGFANPESLKKVLLSQVARHTSTPLRTRLTIQDLDVLQAAVDRVHVPPSVCESLSTLVRSFEAEAAAAIRADPTFLPTRYLSTRTIVRLGKLLRAICVYDHAFRDPARALVVRQADLEMLRLALTLSGPKLADIGALLEQETDPRERRQLELLRSERELFERCLSRLPKLEEPNVDEERANLQTDLVNLEEQPSQKLVTRLQELSSAVDAAHAAAPEAKGLLADIVDELSRRALASGVSLHLGGERAPLDVVRQLATVADELEAASGERRPTARWLRGRALDLLHRSVRLAPTALDAALQVEAMGPASYDVAQQRVTMVLSRLNQGVLLRDALLGGGALQETTDTGDAAWQQAVQTAAEQALRVWDASFRSAVDETLSGWTSRELASVFQALAEPLRCMAETDDWLLKLHPGVRGVRERVVAARLGPVVKAAFDRFDATDRLRVTEHVGAILSTLDAAGVGHALAPADILTWTAEALLRSDNVVQSEEFEPSYEGYLQRRLLEQRVSCAFVLSELCQRLSTRVPPVEPGALLHAIQVELAAIPEVTRQRCLELDLDRVAGPVAFLERWWQAVRNTVEQAPPGEELERLVQSKFLKVTSDEQGLIRFELELELLRRFGDAPAERVDALQRRVRDLAERSQRFAHDVLSRHGETRWARTLAPDVAP